MKYVITNAKLLNGHRDMHVEEGKYIYVSEGKIEKITKSLEDGYDIVDLEGKYILPGLINMHVHLAGMVHILESRKIIRKQWISCFQIP